MVFLRFIFTKKSNHFFENNYLRKINHFISFFMQKIFLSFIFSLLGLPLLAQTFSATLNDTIPDNNTTVVFDIVVSGLPNVIDTTFGLEQACVNIVHTWDADLEVKLESPDGTTVTLLSGVGGSDDNFTNTCLDGVSAPLSSGAAPFTGSFMSMGVIGNVNNGQNPNGTWHLLIRDMAGQDYGILYNWSITFGVNPAMPFIFSSSNLPIVKLTTLANDINNDVKVPVLMQIIDNGPNIRNYTNQTNYAFEGTIMTEWQGFSGPSYPKKNYDFEVVDSFGVEMDTSILNMAVEHDWIFKAEYLDHSLIKNTVTYSMARKMGNYAPDTRPCEIVLDGEYIGYYTLTEKVKRDKFRVDIAKLDSNDISGLNLTGGYIIEMNINGDPADWTSNYLPTNSATACCDVEYKHVYPKSNVILPVQHDYIRAYTDSFENVMASNYFANPDSGYRKYLDIDDFIDFLIVNEFSVNYDSYGRSTYLHKNKGGKLKYGPSWDYDRAMDYNNPQTTDGWVWEITHPYWPFPFHWERAWQDSTYRKQLACRWLMLRQNTLSNDSFMIYIDTLAAHLSEAAGRNFTVWNDLGGQTYTDQIDSLKSYLTRRLAWIDNELAAENVSIPTFYLPTDTILCNGSVFDAAYNGNQFDYNWQPGPDLSNITITQNGTYNLKVTDTFGCYSRKSMEVTLSQPDASFTVSQIGTNSFDWAFSPTDLNANFYNWEFGDGNSASQTSPTHTYAADGTYIISLSIIDSNSCAQVSFDTIQFTVIIIVNELENAASFKGNIYPNPFQTALQIDFYAATTTAMQVSLVNEMGQSVFSKNYTSGTKNISIPTKELSQGIYMLKIVTNENIWSTKVIKM